MAALAAGVVPAVAVGLLVGVTSYADGSSSKTGTTGTVITAFATEARPSTQYLLAFAPALPGGEPCPEADKKPMNPNVRVSTAAGLIGNTSGTVTGAPGTYHVCFYEVGGMSTATAPVLFTIPGTPTISTQASPGGMQGTPVHDSATVTGGVSPGGNVTFRLYSDAQCTTEVFTSTNDLVSGSSTSSSFTPTAAGTYYWTAVYNGDANNYPATSPCNAPNESVVIGAFQAPAPTVTLTSDVLGPVTVRAGESVLITGARVVGPVAVEPGGALTIVNSRISGRITAMSPSFFSACGSEVAGASTVTALSVTNATVPIRVGDPSTGCAGNRFAGRVNVSSSLAVTFGANTLSLDATLDNNGPGKTIVKANTVYGTLGCSGNNPPPTDDGQPNTAGAKSGQCVSL